MIDSEYTMNYGSNKMTGTMRVLYRLHPMGTSSCHSACREIKKYLNGRMVYFRCYNYALGNNENIDDLKVWNRDFDCNELGMVW